MDAGSDGVRCCIGSLYGMRLLHIYETSKAIAEAEKTTNESSGHKANITKSPKGSMCRKLIKKLLAPIVREVIAEEKTRIKAEVYQSVLEDLGKYLEDALKVPV